jgi:hypothetical protein
MGLGGGGGGGVKRLTRSENKRKSGNPSRSNCVRSIAQHKQAHTHRERERERKKERPSAKLKLGT